MKNKDKKVLGNKNVVDRLRRIEGQIRGIEKMFVNDRSCVSIVQQIMAVRSALAQVATKILAEESCRCEYRDKPNEMEKMLNRLVEMN